MSKILIQKITSNFLKDEDGAVTVDWVMLTAGIVLLGVTVASVIRTSLDSATSNIALTIDTANNAFT